MCCWIPYITGWCIQVGEMFVLVLTSSYNLFGFLSFRVSHLLFSSYSLFFYPWNHWIVLFLNVWLALYLAAAVAWRRTRWWWWWLCVECRRTEIRMNWCLGILCIVHVFCVFRISWRDDYDDFVIARNVYIWERVSCGSRSDWRFRMLIIPRNQTIIPMSQYRLRCWPVECGFSSNHDVLAQVL